ncbi:hypothetical protein AB0E96_32900 [Kitasatospora sp. NPDC036755]|uniref:hypothetical protein n=1 Tax=Kitasatospora sp. NPDC036755 TaxID=3154600 RepID=UPI0033EDB6EC
MNRSRTTWLAAPALAAGMLLGAAPAHASTGVRVDSVNVPYGSAMTVYIDVAYSCEAGGPARAAAVIAEDPRTGALGTTRFAPKCTGATVQTSVHVTVVNRSNYVAGDTAVVRFSLLDVNGGEAVGTIARLTIGTA